MSDSVQILNPGSPYMLGAELPRRTHAQFRPQINWSAVIALTANMAAWALLVAVLFTVFG